MNGPLQAIPTYVIALGITSEVKPLENGRRDALQKVRSLLNFESDKEYSRYGLLFFRSICEIFTQIHLNCSVSS